MNTVKLLPRYKQNIDEKKSYYIIVSQLYLSAIEALEIISPSNSNNCTIIIRGR